MMKIKAQPLIVVATLIAVVTMVFQNCAPDVRLMPMPSKTDVVLIDPFKAVMCPNYQAQPPANTKFLFIIDMSASNVGEFGTKQGLAGSYWFENGTDIAGDRFVAIKNFINNCASAATNRFAIIGFAGSAGVLTATNSKEMICDTQFVPAAAALATLQAFANAQAAFRQYMTKYINVPYDGEPIPGVMQGGTSYNKALQCTNDILTEDLTGNLGATNESYHFFFLSDGQPYDGKGKLCDALPVAEREACYHKQIHDGVTYMGQLAIAGQRVLRLTVVGYGAVLGALATYLDFMAGEYDGSKAALLDNFADNPDAFCNLLALRAAIEFRPDFAKALNLTTIRKHGQWSPDSDMDGLTDAEESNSDPTNPRSEVAGVLDSICEGLGGATACQAKVNQLGCSTVVDPSKLVSECDIRITGLPGIASGPKWGIDSDGDGLPDFIEIIKGLNPAVDDVNLDPDGDGRSNYSEILLGSDPFTNDSSLPLSELNSVTNRFVGKSSSDPTCTNGGAWEMTLQRLYGVDTKAIPASAGLPAHEAKHQVAFLFFTLNPSNTATAPSSYYFAPSRFAVDSSDVISGGVLQHQLIMSPVDANPVPSNLFRKMGP